MCISLYLTLYNILTTTGLCISACNSKKKREKEEKWREGHLNRRSEVAGLCSERVEKNGSGCTFSV